MVLRILPAALIAILLVALACGSEPASQPDEATKPAPKVEPTPTVFERLLAFVPDTPDNRRLVRMNDIRGAAAAQGIPIPGFDATPEEMTQFKFDVAFGTERPATTVTQLGESWISGFNQDYVDVSTGTKMSLGFDARDIEAFALLGEANNPPKPIQEILIGAFDAEEAPVLLAACEKCPPHIIENYEGQDFFTWGPADRQNLRDHRQVPPSFDHLGRPGDIVVAADHVFRVLKHADLELLIDTDSGSAGSLLLDEQYRGVASALGDGGAVSAILTDQPFNVETVIQAMCGVECFKQQEERGQLMPGTVDRIRDSISKSGPLEPFNLIGVGLGIDDTGAFALVVLSYDTAEIASKALGQLQARIEVGRYPDIAGDGETESFEDRIPGVQALVEGSMVVAKFWPRSSKELRDFALFPMSSNDGNTYLHNKFVFLIVTE